MENCDPKVKEISNFFIEAYSTLNLEINQLIPDLKNKDKQTKFSQERKIMKNIASDFIQENKKISIFNFVRTIDLLECGNY